MSRKISPQTKNGRFFFIALYTFKVCVFFLTRLIFFYTLRLCACVTGGSRNHYILCLCCCLVPRMAKMMIIIIGRL